MIALNYNWNYMMIPLHLFLSRQLVMLGENVGTLVNVIKVIENGLIQ